MAINLASKYASKVDERFSKESLTDAQVNQDYEFTGVVTVQVYSIDVVDMGDYTRSGSARYGTAAELGDAIQTLTLTKDRAFTFTIDKGNQSEQQMVKKGNVALKRQIDQKVIPEVDQRRIAVMSAAGIANGATDATPATTSNAYTLFLAGNEVLDDALVPMKGRFAYCTPSFINKVKQDTTFVLASEMGQKALMNGQIGEIDGVAIIKVPSSYFPANHEFIIGHKMAVVGPKKLNDYKIHDNPPGS
jgi:N4-gp56 family major capsid protein